MKKALFTLIFSLYFGFSFSQTTGNQVKVENKELKAVGRTLPADEKNNQAETKSEPVIILHLEYNAVENNTKIDEKLVDKVETIKLVPDRTIDQEIADADAMINAIDTKIEWVKNNPEENKKAIASGWFDQMEGYRQNAQSKKDELIKLKK
jgi:hypothetical protein